MADEVENPTIRLLQEMRAEANEFRAEVKVRFDEVNERFDTPDNRVDGNSLILSMLAGLVSKRENRLDRLEEGRS